MIVRGVGAVTLPDDVDDDDSETRVGWMASTDSGRLWGQAKQNVWLTSGPTKAGRGGTSPIANPPFNLETSTS